MPKGRVYFSGGRCLTGLGKHQDLSIIMELEKLGWDVTYPLNECHSRMRKMKDPPLYGKDSVPANLCLDIMGECDILLVYIGTPDPGTSFEHGYWIGMFPEKPVVLWSDSVQTTGEHAGRDILVRSGDAREKHTLKDAVPYNLMHSLHDCFVDVSARVFSDDKGISPEKMAKSLDIAMSGAMKEI